MKKTNEKNRNALVNKFFGITACLILMIIFCPIVRTANNTAHAAESDSANQQENHLNEDSNCTYNAEDFQFTIRNDGYQIYYDDWFIYSIEPPIEIRDNTGKILKIYKDYRIDIREGYYLVGLSGEECSGKKTLNISGIGEYFGDKIINIDFDKYPAKIVDSINVDTDPLTNKLTIFFNDKKNHGSVIVESLTKDIVEIANTTRNKRNAKAVNSNCLTYDIKTKKTGLALLKITIPATKYNLKTVYYIRKNVSEANTHILGKHSYSKGSLTLDFQVSERFLNHLINTKYIPDYVKNYTDYKAPQCEIDGFIVVLTTSKNMITYNLVNDRTMKDKNAIIRYIPIPDKKEVRNKKVASGVKIDKESKGIIYDATYKTKDSSGQSVTMNIKDGYLFEITIKGLPSGKKYYTNVYPYKEVNEGDVTRFNKLSNGHVIMVSEKKGQEMIKNKTLNFYDEIHSYVSVINGIPSNKMVGLATEPPIVGNNNDTSDMLYKKVKIK